MTAEEAKSAAYHERNQLVAYLASLFPACLERHPEEDRDWEDDWRWIVFIHHPEGQLSWHIHDSELSLFDHVQRDNQACPLSHLVEHRPRKG